MYSALSNWAGGLYGGILTKVLTTDPMQWGLHTRLRSRFYQTDRLSSVNKPKKKTLIKGKQEKSYSFYECNWFVLADNLLANSDQRNLNLPKFARALYQTELLTLEKKYGKNKSSKYLCILVWTFFAWEKLNHGQNQFQPIKFGYSVVNHGHTIWREQYIKLPSFRGV